MARTRLHHTISSLATPLLLFLLLASSSRITTTRSATAAGADGTCLADLYTALHDPRNNLPNWKNNSNLLNPCPALDSNSTLDGVTCNNGRVFKLSLPSLSLSGTLSPTSLQQCTNLQTLDLSSNSFSGDIPYLIFNSGLLNLAVLNLSRNRFAGAIPPQIALCTYLNVLDLHANLLSGPIPLQLGYLTRLTVLDLSDNRLTGEIPANLAVVVARGRSDDDQPPRFNRSSFAGNAGLYGYPLDGARNNKKKSKAGLSVVEIVGVGLGSGFLSLLVSFTVVCCWLRTSERRRIEREAIQHLDQSGKY